MMNKWKAACWALFFRLLAIIQNILLPKNQPTLTMKMSF
jgi:hypothetical protein